jgi:hypothetical protein
MTHVSQTDLWTSAGNGVVTLAPSRDDVMVVTTVGGRPVFVEPVHLYDDAVRRAQAFVRRAKHGAGFTVKVLCLTLREARRMGFVDGELGGQATPEQEARDRQLVVTTLRGVMRDSNEAKARIAAYDILTDMGELK